MKIALIIGHSKAHGGAKNKTLGVNEYEFNEPLAHGVAKELERIGYEPVIVYRNDVSYRDLPKKVNSTGADLAISFHCNAFNKAANGSETLYYKRSVEGKKLANAMQSNIVNYLKFPDRGVKARVASHKGKAGDKGGHLLKYTSMPCVITEPFFIDCDKALQFAIDNMHDLISAYVAGVVSYNGLKG